MINHRPFINVEKAVKLYSEKDGVPVKYVCTTALVDRDLLAMDVFYRDTPHPEFGNKYFGLFWHQEKLYVTNADSVEDLSFGTIKADDSIVYSRDRHDFVSLGDGFIDGGRAYIRTGGSTLPTITIYHVKDGEFIKKEETDVELQGTG